MVRNIRQIVFAGILVAGLVASPGVFAQGEDDAGSSASSQADQMMTQARAALSAAQAIQTSIQETGQGSPSCISRIISSITGYIGMMEQAKGQLESATDQTTINEKINFMSSTLQRISTARGNASACQSGSGGAGSGTSQGGGTTQTQEGGQTFDQSENTIDQQRQGATGIDPGSTTETGNSVNNDSATGGGSAGASTGDVSSGGGGTRPDCSPFC